MYQLILRHCIFTNDRGRGKVSLHRNLKGYPGGEASQVEGVLEEVGEDCGLVQLVGVPVATREGEEKLNNQEKNHGASYLGEELASEGE